MSNLLINEPPLMVLPSLASKIGLNEAIVLQQIHYWLNPKINKNYKEEKHWVYNSYEQWQEQFTFWSIDTIKRTITALEKLGLLISKNFNSSKFNKTKWYTVDYEKLKLLTSCTDRSAQSALSMKANSTIDQCKMPSSYIDTETTTDNKTSPSLPQPILKEEKRGGGLIKEYDLGKKEMFSQNNNKALFFKNQKTVEQEKQQPFVINPLAQHMVDIWDQTVREGQGSKSYLRGPRQTNLLYVLETYFDHNLENWKKFCSIITSSKHLMGETDAKFTAGIDWVIAPEHVEKILEGKYRADRGVFTKDPYESARKIFDFLSGDDLNYYKNFYVEERQKKDPSFSIDENDPALFTSGYFKHFVVTELMKKFLPKK